MSTDPRVPTADFFVGGGEMGERIRGFDWSETTLGPIETWSAELRVIVRFLLANRFPLLLWWGPEYVSIYNDAYRPILGTKHPWALGRPVSEVWSEIWDVLRPLIDTPFQGGPSTWNEDISLEINRHGFLEETHFTVAYSPVPDETAANGIGGVLATVHEITEKVVGERRLEALRDLGVRTGEARSAEEACVAAAQTLERHGQDLPFALLYLIDNDGRRARLAGAAGVANGDQSGPTSIDLDGEVEGTWPLAEAARTNTTVVVDDLAVHLGAGYVAGPLPDPPRRAVVVPIASTVQEDVAGFLVAGISPRLALDARYLSFVELVAGQISTTIAGARAFEDAQRQLDALAEIDRAKTVFFSNVSHEFRTPLTLMLGPLEDMLHEGRSDSQSIEVVHRNALRLLRMVNTVLDFSRVESAQTVVELRPADLSRLTAEIAASFSSLFERGGVELVVDCPPLPGLVFVDVDAWEKIVLNLLSNAFKFTLAGEIRLTIDADGDRARLRVSDTGTGIPETELPRLFERFHRIRNENARTQEGTGIGLALVRELVELHGGTTSAESTIDQGTTITVSIPISTAQPFPEQAQNPSSGDQSRGIAHAYVEEASRWIGVESDEIAPSHDWVSNSDTVSESAARIVVVDDNADMRDYLERLLRRHWRVDVYPDGEAALEAIRTDPPSLVITDVMMPRLDGFGLLAALRNDLTTATLPVIVVSARAGEESAVGGLEAGADDYLVKPFSARELIARVRVNLELARLRGEAGRLAALEDVRSHVITTVSHELRTPVSAIYGAVSTLKEHQHLDEEIRRRLLAVIGTESARLARITTDILTTESLTTGRILPRRERVDLRTPMLAAISAAQACIENPDRLHAHVTDQSTIVEVDPNRMQQIITNLLDNAIKYSDGNNEVLVRLERMDGHANIVIADNGIGIPPDALDRIFERFYRVDPQSTGGVGGTGLGLYISREIVRTMGGRIWAQANEPNGSRFTVSFPVVGD